MNQKPILKSLAMLAIGVLFVVGNPVPVEVGGEAIAGSYLALLDLGPLGFGSRIETFGVYLDDNGGVLMTSEHEDDKESAGVGVWEHLGGGLIGIGTFNFRFGPAPATSLCGFVGVTSPPDNCVLKLGATLSREHDSDSDSDSDSGGGVLVGELFLTIENLDGTVVHEFPPPLPITMERLRLEDFPGALP